MRRAVLAMAAAGLLATAGMTGCTDGGGKTSTDSGSGGKGGRAGGAPIGVILPDSRLTAETFADAASVWDAVRETMEA